jgi:hypothetical protein
VPVGISAVKTLFRILGIKDGHSFLGISTAPNAAKI